MPTFLAPLLKRPLVCLAICWIGGILLSSWLPLPMWVWPVAGVLAAAVACAQLLRGVPGAKVALLCAVVAAGGWAAILQGQTLRPFHAQVTPGEGVVVRGYTLTPPASAGFGWHAIFRVQTLRRGARWIACRADVYLTGTATPPRHGRQALLTAIQQPAEVARHPYGFSWPAFLLQRGLSARLRLLEAHVLATPAPVSLRDQAREFMRLRLHAALPPDQRDRDAPLLESLVLGVHGTALPRAMVETYRRAGTIHIMVVSGSQVALLAGILLWPLVLLNGRRSYTSFPRLRVLLTLLALPLLGMYVLLADRGASIDRALCMCALAALAVLLALSPWGNRRYVHPDGPTLLAAAALILLIPHPALLAHPGLQLSFAAVGGLVTLTPLLMRLLYRVLGRIALIPAATLGAQLMVYPVLAWHFGTLPLAGLGSNLLAVPLVGYLLPAGLLFLGIAALSPALAAPLAPCVLVPLHWLHTVSDIAARLPNTEIPWVVRSPGPLIFYYGVLALIAYGLSRWADRLDQDWGVPAGRAPRMW